MSENCQVLGPKGLQQSHSFDLHGLVYNEIKVDEIPIREHLNAQTIITLQQTSSTQMTWGMGDELFQGSLFKDQLIITPAGFPHFSGWQSPSSFSNFFLYPRFNISINESFQEDLPQALVPKIGFEDPFLKKIFSLIKSEVKSNEVADPLYIDTLILMLGKHLNLNFRLKETKLQKISGPQLSQIDGFIRDNLDQPISLKMLAATVNMSPYHFSRLFKAKTGAAPYHYVQIARINRSKELLKKTNWAIGRIALECGFNSQSHFTSQFKKFVGATPSTFR